MFAQARRNSKSILAKGNKAVGDRKRKQYTCRLNLSRTLTLKPKSRVSIMDFYHRLVNESWQAYKHWPFAGKDD